MIKSLVNFSKAVEREWYNITWLDKNNLFERFFAVFMGVALILSIIILGDALGDFIIAALLEFKNR